ncbi:MAG: LamG domain-containing protein [Ignavibacteriaceae bacterium]
MKIPKFIVTIILFLLLLSFTSQKQVEEFKIDVSLGEFGAFYTKLNSGMEFETNSRTGEYADIVVDLGNNDAMLVFWRGSSYLPFLKSSKGKWYVDEIVARKGDGSEIMPDRTNTFSHVQIIQSNPEEVIVHWRYLPEFIKANPPVGVDATKFVDEYYYIKPDGTVKRTIRKGTKRVDDWRIPDNVIVETCKLTLDGIDDVQLVEPQKPDKPAPVKGNPVIADQVVQPVAWWNFDEAMGDEATEVISKIKSEIHGNKSLWRKGVSGTALQFDGYISKITLPANDAPNLSGAFTFEAWLAIGAYPWSFVPIVQQADDVIEEVEKTKGQLAVLLGEEGREEMDEDEMGEFDFIMKKEDDTGYFFGLDGYGNPTLKVRVGNQWEELITDNHLDRRTWYYVAASYDKSTGYMKVYVDGKKVGEKEIAKGDIELSTKDLFIGQGKLRRPIRPVRMNTFADQYSFDGLFDEIKIYDVALTDTQIKESYDSYLGNKEYFSEVDMDKRVLPEGDNTGEFGSYYTHLKFYDVWDNMWRFSAHPDVVVEFDQLPTKFVFWRGVGYIPMMVNDKGQWYSNEFNETWNRSGGEGCQEPMSDKESYNNHARIIENTPARTVVHWRYPLIDVNHIMANFDEGSGWCDWSDWYYYVYPDGIAVKTMHLWTDGERDHEWQESMAIFGPDQHPEDIIHKKNALTMLNLKGDAVVYDWVKGPPDNVEEPDGQCIQYVNYTGEYKPVTIGDFEWSNVYGGELTEYAVFPTWNHWPVGQMPSDGRYATYSDRTSHSSLTHVPPTTYKEVLDGPTPYYQKILMEGMLNMRPDDLVPLARSWMKAPRMAELSGADGEYEPGQRAYLLKFKSSPVSFKIDASDQSPSINPAFVLKGWNDQSIAKVKINGKELTAGDNFRQGTFRDTDGTQTMVVWIEKDSIQPVSIEIVK